MKDWTVEKLLAAVTLLALLIGCVSTWAIAFNKIADHEKRIDDIETANKTNGKELGEKLQKIQSAVDFMNWRMDGVTKTLEKQEKKR